MSVSIAVIDWSNPWVIVGLVIVTMMVLIGLKIMSTFGATTFDKPEDEPCVAKKTRPHLEQGSPISAPTDDRDDTAGRVP